MNLYEIFDSKVKSDVTAQGASFYKVTAKIGSRDIIITFGKIDSGEDIWNFEFMEYNGKVKTTSQTGSGHELQVFSLVKDILKDFISIYHPNIIRFSADKSEGNRAKLYERMLKKLNLPKYKVEIEDHASDKIFQLISQ